MNDPQEFTWVYRTLILPAAIAPQARALADAMGPSSSGMWVTGLSADGAAPATHFISAGLIGSDFAGMLATPEALAAGAETLGVPIPIETAQALLGLAVIDERPFQDVLDELGLQLVHDDGGTL